MDKVTTNQKSETTSQARDLTMRLIHVFTCKDVDCYHNPFCADFKQLYNLHIRLCSDSNCRIRFCKNTRVIIRHSRGCRLPDCPVCSLLRESRVRIEKNKKEREMKDKRERLLQLFHASKCTFKKGECIHNPFCADLQKLWAHCIQCKDSACKIMPHCLSSRLVLIHYGKCKGCEMCIPVRQTIQGHFSPASDAVNGLMLLSGGTKNPNKFTWF